MNQKCVVLKDLSTFEVTNWEQYDAQFGKDAPYSQLVEQKLGKRTPD